MSELTANGGPPRLYRRGHTLTWSSTPEGVQLVSFECEAERVGSAAVVTVRGELDIYTAEKFRKVLSQVKAWRVGSRLVIDLTECSFMDSTALGVLMRAKHRLDSPLNIAAHVGALRVLTISGFDKVLQIHGSREEALAALDQEGSSSTGLPNTTL